MSCPLQTSNIISEMRTQYILKNASGTFYYSDEKMTKLHREDGPAIEWSDGSKHWYLNGKWHREDGPAVELADGSKYWWLNGKRHREDGPAIELADGSKHWYSNGKLHREDGPAIEWSDGSKSWYLNGQRHREDGPAIQYANGTKHWYLNGEGLSKEEWEKRVMKKKTININGKAFTLEELNALIDLAKK